MPHRQSITIIPESLVSENRNWGSTWQSRACNIQVEYLTASDSIFQNIGYTVIENSQCLILDSELVNVLAWYWRDIWHRFWLMLAPEYGLACSGAIHLTFVAKTVSGMLALLPALLPAEPLAGAFYFPDQWGRDNLGCAINIWPSHQVQWDRALESDTSSVQIKTKYWPNKCFFHAENMNSFPWMALRRKRFVWEEKPKQDQGIQRQERENKGKNCKFVRRGDS
ncbi:hypothetical protein GGX14DRAFT_403601 [Mycena pura]|uniref:Uncharacterized protein n=1 Tax=Mycena pura TaxID=153505 RepID=A0AAD6V338_9AGAR|nr:hypothetical protein GGX14DRAFT_403601 [Mycena pura]